MRAPGCSGRNRGSAVLLVLFVCLAVAVLVAGSGAAVRLATAGEAEERAGRRADAETDGALTAAGEQLQTSWQTTELTWEGSRTHVVSVGAGETELAEPLWNLPARVGPEARTDGWGVSAWMERGRDGLDLPWAGVVASRVVADAGHPVPWIALSQGAVSALSADGTVPVATRWDAPPEALGEGCSPLRLAEPWTLDEGWRRRLEATGRSGVEPVGGSSVAVADVAGGAANIVQGDPGETVSVGALGAAMEEGIGRAPDRPLLVVVLGGAALDARNYEDLYGVLLADGGSILLSGTVLHGAAYAAEDLSLGADGSVVFDPQVYRWATDRSLRLVRAAPGSRREGVGLSPGPGSG